MCHLEIPWFCSRHCSFWSDHRSGNWYLIGSSNSCYHLVSKYCVEACLDITLQIRSLLEIRPPVLQSPFNNQSINQTSIAPISPAKPGSVARQLNQCSTAKSQKQFHNINKPSGTPGFYGRKAMSKRCVFRCFLNGAGIAEWGLVCWTGYRFVMRQSLHCRFRTPACSPKQGTLS